MSKTRSRSDAVREDDALRLPLPPGVLRRFWARHPVFADVLIVIVCLLLSLLRMSDGALIAVLSVIACAALLVRRRHPVLAFAVVLAAETLYPLIGMPGGTPMLLVAMYSLAVYGSARIAWIGLGLALAAPVGVTALMIALGASTLPAAANNVIGNLLAGLIGALVGMNVGGRKRYVAAIIDRSRQLLVERDQQAQLAAAAERERIAREMHDIVSHSLTVIVALSEGAAATTDAERARSAATTTAATARAALGEMRSMLGVLRDDDAPLPLAPVLPPTPRDTVAHAQRAGFPVSLTVTGNTEHTAAVEHAVSRLVQEGVTNAMRHAPKATSMGVRVERSPEAVVVEVVNDGVGTGTRSPDSSGFGLRGLTERVAHVHGQIDYGRSEDGRWRLHAVIPGETPAQTAADERER